MRDFNVDGVLVGKPYQRIWERSTVQRYPIGMVYENHGRRFRYCHACEDVTITHTGLPNMSRHGGDTLGSAWAVMGTIGTKAYAGDTFVIMANLGGGSLGTIFPLDWFYNGTINFYVPHADYTDLLSMRISGSEIATASAVKIYLDEPLPCDIAATVFAEAHPSPYLNIGANNNVGANYSAVVVNHVELVSGEYFWGQTKGPCYVQRNVNVDTSARKKVFISGIIEDDGADDIRQMVGYALIPRLSDGMVMLMLE